MLIQKTAPIRRTCINYLPSSYQHISYTIYHSDLLKHSYTGEVCSQGTWRQLFQGHTASLCAHAQYAISCSIIPGQLFLEMPDSLVLYIPEIMLA